MVDLDALTHHDVLPDGTRVLMRALRPEDSALYPDFVAHVTLEDARLRFFSVRITAHVMRYPHRMQRPFTAWSGGVSCGGRTVTARTPRHLGHGRLSLRASS